MRGLLLAQVLRKREVAASAMLARAAAKAMAAAGWAAAAAMLPMAAAKAMAAAGWAAAAAMLAGAAAAMAAAGWAAAAAMLAGAAAKAMAAAAGWALSAVGAPAAYGRVWLRLVFPPIPGARGPLVAPAVAPSCLFKALLLRHRLTLPKVNEFWRVPGRSSSLLDVQPIAARVLRSG